MIDEGLRLRHCGECSTVSPFDAYGVYQDGSQRMICRGCRTNGGILHSCQHANPFGHPEWLPLLLVGIDIVCPKCKAAYDLGLKIEPISPDLGKALQAVGLFVGTAILVAAVVEIAQSQKRR